MTEDTGYEWARTKREYARAYFVHIRGLKLRSRSLADQVDELRDSADGLGAMDYSRVRVSASASPDAVPNAVAAIQAAVADYASTLAEWAAECGRAADVLDGIDPAQAHAITRHYLQGWSREETAAEMCYSDRNVGYILEAGLEAAYDRLPAEWRLPRHPAL